ncbi:MAG: glycosyl hydrolase [Bacteroidota bacterium]
MNQKITLPFLTVVALSLGFHWMTDNRLDDIKTVDPLATPHTKALYANLKKHASQHILFGHQDALAYGVLWRDWHRMRSDVKDVCGKHPMVFGWDVSKLGTSTVNIDTVDFSQMKRWIKEVYKAGGVNTISWHMDNFHGGDSWKTGKKVVASILPGGDKHEAYKAKLDQFADFVDDLKVGFIFKRPIPIIFRPFHEHTGRWFWWGKGHRKTEEYIALWRFTVEYLRDEKGLHNLLWAYSPDVVKDEAHYLECYPGDEYVDILGLDNYADVGRRGRFDKLVQRLQIVVRLAQQKGKVAALTETGFERIPDKKWWTQKMLKHIKEDPVASQIAWMLVWRNARKSHHYAPYPSHKSAEDFIRFSKDPMMVFQGDIPNIYRLD